jgi:signal transduction histidine kinase
MGIHGLEVSSRINDVTGRPIGVIMGFVDINSVAWSTIGGIEHSMYSSGEVVLLTSDETVIFSTVPFKPLEETSAPISGQSLTGSSGSFVGEENSRTRQYYFSRSEGYSDYDGHGWLLVISYDRQQVLSPLTDLRNTTLALSASLGVVFLLGTYMLLSRLVKKPLTEFRKTAAQITHGNLEKRVHITSRDEIGELASDFNIMTDRLQEQIQGLEERVAERTRELEVINKDLEAFSYSVSHDLRAPLRSIDGFSHALLEDYADKLDAQGKDYLNRVRNGSQRMALLIDDILKLSRVSREKMVTGRVDLSALARSVASELQKSQPTRDVGFRIEDGVVVEGDQGLLKIVLDNLLGNAWKFTGRTQKALIEFGSQMMDGTKTYFVRDNGVGFDMAYASKLFTPFQRLHGPGEFPGTGIGLSIVQRVIRRHGGRIWAEAAVNAGATFYFILPRATRSLKR